MDWPPHKLRRLLSSNEKKQFERDALNGSLFVPFRCLVVLSARASWPSLPTPNIRSRRSHPNFDSFFSCFIVDFAPASALPYVTRKSKSTACALERSLSKGKRDVTPSAKRNSSIGEISGRHVKICESGHRNSDGILTLSRWGKKNRSRVLEIFFLCMHLCQKNLCRMAAKSNAGRRNGKRVTRVNSVEAIQRTPYANGPD